MFKIKLLILLPISLLVIACTKNPQSQNKVSYSLGYVGGEYDGLVLKNLLTNYLSSFELYDNNSIYKIEADISHSSSLFITNIDNTSDRMRVDSDLSIEIIDRRFNCITNKFEANASQYYLFADTAKFISNSQAEKKIKEENTEILVKEFISEIRKPKSICSRINE